VGKPTLGPASRDVVSYDAVTGSFMPKTPLDPPVSDQAPDGNTLTDYDHEHLVTYLRLLDADTEGANWTEVARIVLHIDPKQEPQRARRAWESHLARAKWMMEQGYHHLLEGLPGH
jgi:Uncharacterized conserved protein (DUF2285)